jgi:drug/metabolite transporter (DMT)-like permease
MIKKPASHFTSVLQALLVTFLWSTSFIIIKIGLKDLSPLVFAGMRYFLAFLILLPFLFTNKNRSNFREINRSDWYKLLLLGFLFYTITQAAQFIGLSLLPSVTVSIILNFTPLFVAIIAILFLNEIPASLQWSGVILFIIGVLIYFYPLKFSKEYLSGIIIMFLAVLANAFSAILGRSVNRESKLEPVVITVISMGFGSIILFIISLIVEGLPNLSLISVIYIIWLAAVNTAFAFNLWNLTLRNLTAVESSIINGTMLIQIAILAWIFLGENLTFIKILGMVITSIGAFLVQIKKRF